ncbi:GyrI-like domain-containing protein [Pedobacter antarcticus]|uniref:Transcriptional regulator n=2 Tax=Pedobacter antarcticus TaxID=34086 RepID=A0A081PCI8_9SPHI|nr:effector binding domain-containing protein [Pedobacter antarcticus]KEQ28411.1 transcriptional regulator [Pedobacter antarcticus 4BY]SDM86014.1 Predicted transcriptional regulator YdeE, contains AraC-type DNA-binding domain [Pedobacter antarcticus]SFF04652.1 Predicted transcriptional regulator YdeE, contains AraC-type DNA-binding domain [Pedobacter antarcticus]
MRIEETYIIGLPVRTTNENGQSAKDIPLLWERFFSENIAAGIPGTTGPEVYCIYTDYEDDYTKPYTTILGCPVADLSQIPEGLTGHTIAAGNYKHFQAKGKLNEGIVYKEWTGIWNSDIQRTYDSDFEIYGEKAQDPENATVDIFISVPR